MGFLVPWFITEVVQVLFILRFNLRLFVSTTELDFLPVYKLFALMGLAVLLGSWFAIHAQQKSLLQASVTAMVFVMVLALISYPLFHVGDVRIYLRDRMALRNQKSA